MEKRRVYTPKGEIEYYFARRSKKNLRLYIREADGSVQVSGTRYTTLKNADEFVQKNYEFVFNALEKLKRLNTNRDKSLGGALKEGDSLLVLGKELPIKIVESSENRADLVDNEIILRVNDINSYELKYNIIEDMLNRLRKEVYVAVLEKWYPPFKKLGIKKPQLVVKPSISKWGYCNSLKGVVMMNSALIHVPLPLIEYLVLHELSHFIHPDHSKAYWEFVTMGMPDCKERRKALQTWGHLLRK